MVTAIVGGLIGWGIGAAAGLTMATAFTIWQAVMIGMSLGSLVGGLIQQNNANYDSSPTYSFGQISNTMSQNLPIPVIYGGEMRVAGNIIYQAYDSDEKKVQTLYVLLSEGEIENVRDVMANDQLVTSLPDCSLTIYKTTAANTHDSRDPSGTRPYPDNVAMLCMTLTASEKLNSQPTITSIVKGVKVWTPNGKVWSTNPIWCAIDLLANPRYGLGLCTYSNGAYDHPDWAQIDYTAAVTAANYCDGLVNGEKRFELTYVLDTQKPIKDVLNEMLSTCRGYMVETDKIQFHIDAPVNNYTREITTAHLVEGSFTWWQKTSEDMSNQFTVDWVDPNTSYDRVTDVFQDSNDIADRGIVTSSVQLVGITRQSQVERMGYYLLKTSLLVRNLCSFNVGIKDCDILPGEVIAITYAEFTGWNKKWFRVVSTKVVSETEMTVVCAEYIAACYDDSSIAVVSHIDTQRTKSYTPQEVTNLTVTEEVTFAEDGQYINTVIASWTPSSYANSVEVWYRFDNDAYYTMAATLSLNSTEFRLDCTTHSVVYFKIITVSSIGIHSSGVVARHTITGDVTPPAAPTNLTGTGGYKLANLKWSDPADNDLDHVDVYRSSDGSSYIVAGRSFRGEQAFIDTNLGILTNYWYKLKAVDSAGNESVFSAVTQTQTTAIPAADIPDKSIDGTKTVTDIFGDTESTANAVVEQVLNNYGDTKRTTTKISETNSALEITQGILAEAGVRIDDLETTTEQTVSRLGNAEQRITTAEGVLDEAVADITQLTQRVGDTEQDITDVNVVVEGHTASISGLTQRVGTAESDIDSAEQNITTLQQTTAQQATALQSVTQRVGTTETNVTNLTTTVNGAVADIRTVEANLGNTNVKVERNIGAVDANTAENNNVALAQIEDLLSLYNGNKGTGVKISEVKEVLDDVTGRWYVKIDNNKRVAGLALYNGSEESNFTVLADKFFIYGNGTGGSELKQVFAVDTTTGKVVLQGDLLADGSITGAKINAAAQITLGNGGQLIMGAGSVLQMASGAVVLDSENGVLQIKNHNDLENGDFIKIETGNVVTYKKINGTYQPLRSLNKIVSGVANSGSVVTLTGLPNIPSILPSLRSIGSYDPTFSQAQQSISCDIQDMAYNDTTGVCTFTPVIKTTVGSFPVEDTTYREQKSVSSNIDEPLSFANKTLTLTATLPDAAGTNLNIECDVCANMLVKYNGDCWNFKTFADASFEVGGVSTPVLTGQLMKPFRADDTVPYRMRAYYPCFRNKGAVTRYTHDDGDWKPYTVNGWGSYATRVNCTKASFSGNTIIFTAHFYLPIIPSNPNAVKYDSHDYADSHRVWTYISEGVGAYEDVTGAAISINRISYNTNEGTQISTGSINYIAIA